MCELFSNDIYTVHQLFNHIMGAIISLIVAGLFYIFKDIHKKYISKKPSITLQQKNKLIKEVNLRILDRLYFLIDNKEYIDRFLITRVRYLHTINSRHLKLEDVITEDNVLENLLTHIIASRSLSTDEKVKMAKQIYLNTDCFHWNLLNKVIFHFICFNLIFISLYYILHIEYFYQKVQNIFHSYTEYVVIPWLLMFSVLISHYIYVAYRQYSPFKFK